MIAKLLTLLPKLKSFTVLGTLFSVASFYATHLYYSERITSLELELSKKNSAQIENVLQAERAATATMREIEKLMDEKSNATVERYHEIQADIKNHNENADSGSGSAVIDDPDWVRQHNSGVPLPGVTSTTDRIDETSTGVQKNKSEIETIIENYRSCQIVVDRLQGWKLWYERLQHGRRAE